MAEAWLNNLRGDRFAAESAGLEPGTINSLVVEVMSEAGIEGCCSASESRGQ
ncbi:MAG: hypothetical protein ABR611_06400 [Chthoniobacterales bacterium]